MQGKIVRLNVDNPEDMARLLRSGSIWTLPQYWQKAMDAIRDGLVPLAECKNVPPEVMAGLRK